MTHYELSQQYKHQIEAWHLFYESFKESTEAVIISRAILVDMQSEVIKASKSNPDNPKLKATEKRVDTLHLMLDILEKLNNRCVQLQSHMKVVVADRLQAQNENEELKKQIEQLKNSIELI